MLNYFLCLNLKRAGFPQLEEGNGFYFEPGTSIIESDNESLADELVFPHRSKLAQERVYCPTLEELRERLPKDDQNGFFPEEAFAYAYIVEIGSAKRI